MAGLSVAHQVALAAIVERAPDPMLANLSQVVGSLPGERARELQTMLAVEALDRRRRAIVLMPLLPMFRQRADGIECMTFPVGVLPRLWKAASSREPELLCRLDDDGPDVMPVVNRICLAAASVVRDKPDLIWPVDANPAAREKGLADLATCLDLARLARDALPSLEIWLKRPDGDQIAELRLLLKDCAGVHHDGSQRVLEILFSHLEDAVLILRVITQTSGVAERESFLSASELADFVQRLIVGVEVRAARIAAFQSGATKVRVEEIIADFSWCAAVLSELDITLTLNPQSAWGKSVRDGRVMISGQLSSFLRAADKAVDKALPLAKVKIGGRMSRKCPLMTAPFEGPDVNSVRNLLKLVGSVRGAASVFGAESNRKLLVESLTARLSDYADEALHMVNDGEVADEAHALKLIALASHCLALINAKDAARTVRRRAAVAGADKDDKASSRAA